MNRSPVVHDLPKVLLLRESPGIRHEQARKLEVGAESTVGTSSFDVPVVEASIQDCWDRATSPGNPARKASIVEWAPSLIGSMTI